MNDPNRQAGYHVGHQVFLEKHSVLMDLKVKECSLWDKCVEIIYEALEAYLYVSSKSVI